MRWMNIIFVVMLWGTASFSTEATPVIQAAPVTQNAFTVTLSASEGSSPQNVDVAHMLFGHIGDSYGWHITDWNGRHITIPLPCILYSRESGWSAFMSSKLEHGHEYDGFYLAQEGRYEGKIVEVGKDGDQIRPFDLSITKNVASLMITALLLIALVLATARWYRHHDAAQEGAPGGFAGLMEMMIMMVNDDLIRPSVGEHCYRKYAPYLLTVFFFIFLSNLL